MPFKISPTKVLRNAAGAELERVIVIGRLRNGEIYASSSNGINSSLVDIDEFRDKINHGDFSDEERTPSEPDEVTL